jgi:hypothetical protein
VGTRLPYLGVTATSKTQPERNASKTVTSHLQSTCSGKASGPPASRADPDGAGRPQRHMPRACRTCCQSRRLPIGGTFDVHRSSTGACCHALLDERTTLGRRRARRGDRRRPTLRAPGVEELLEATRRPGWVAEQPELHLLPHLQRACESSALQLLDARASGDGVFDVELRWTGETKSFGAVKATVFALVGSFAEPSTHVRQLRSESNETRTRSSSRS